MDQNIRPRAPFTLRNKHTAQECEFHDQAEVDNFRAEVEHAADWELVSADAAAPAAAASEPAAAAEVEVEETPAAPEAPAAAPAVNEEVPAAAPKKARAKKA